MSDEAASGGLHIDSDWKEEAALEKERLVAQEKMDREQKDAASTEHAPFLELVNLLAMQAAVGLGGMKDPAGGTIPPNPGLAKLYIDLMEVLKEKTQGNLTDDEGRVLDEVLYELRMQYVQSVGGAPPTTMEQQIKTE